MSEEVLSQEELDALKDVSANKSDGGEEGVSLYDFHQPVHILKTRLPAIEIINDRFSKLLEILMQTFVSNNVNIIIEDVEMVKYEDYMASIPPVTNSIKTKMSPINGSMLMVNMPSLVYSLVECYFGAKGELSEIEPRDFTLTELGVMYKFNEELLNIYAKSWDSIHPLKFDFVASENRSQAISFIDQSDIVIVNKFIAEIENIKGEIHILLPYAAFEPIKNILVSGIARENVNTDDYWYKELQNKMHEADIELRAVLSQTEVSLSELLNLKEGDFIPLRVHETCTVYSDELPIFEAKVGSSNQAAAIRVSRWYRH